MSLDINTTAAEAFYRAVRMLCANAKPWTRGVIFVDTTPAERWDITKLSQRIYDTRDEALTVMAAANMNSMADLMEQQRIALPTKERLLALKRQVGYESTPALRRDGAPVWLGG